MAKLNMQAANSQQMIQNLAQFADNIGDNDVVAAGRKEGIYGDAKNHGKSSWIATAKGDRERLVAKLKTLGDTHFKNDPVMKKAWDKGIDPFSHNSKYDVDVKGSDFKSFVKNMVNELKLSQMVQTTIAKCGVNDMPKGADAYVDFAKKQMNKGDLKGAQKTLNDMKTSFPGKLDFLGAPKQKIELQEYNPNKVLTDIDKAPIQQQQPKPLTQEQIKTRNAALSMVVNSEVTNAKSRFLGDNSDLKTGAPNQFAMMNHSNVNANEVAEFDQMMDVIANDVATPGGPEGSNETGGPDPALLNAPNDPVVNENEVEGDLQTGDLKGKYQENAMQKLSYYLDEGQ